MKTMTLTQAIRDYFGPRPGVENTTGNFMKEFKALTAQDKDEIRAGLIATGLYKIVDLSASQMKAPMVEPIPMGVPA